MPKKYLQIPVTESPLSALGSVCLHPGSLATEYPISFQEYERRRADILNSLNVIDMQQTKSSIFHDAAELMAVQTHEQDHLNRLCGTTFGFFLDNIRCYWMQNVVHVISNRLREKSQIHLPIRYQTPFDKAQSDQQNNESFREEWLCQGLSLSLVGMMDHVTGDQFEQAIWGLMNGDEIKIQTLLGSSTYENQLYYKRKRAYSNNDEFLTTRHLLELLAWRTQGNVLLNVNSHLSSVEDLFNSSQYELAFDCWRQFVPEAPKGVRKNYSNRSPFSSQKLLLREGN